MGGVLAPIVEKKIDLMFCRIKKTNTLLTEKAMAKYYDCAEPLREMVLIDLFKADEAEANRFHFVFCLDESWSMEGAKWEALLKAYQGFLTKRRNDQGVGDVVSVVTFNSEFKIHHEAQPIMSVRSSLLGQGGGTNFDAALEGASQVLQKTPAGAIPMIVFMSDGEGHGTPVPTITALRARHPGFVCHCVGLGAADMVTLNKMSDAGGGKTWQSEVGSIADVFGEIAAGCSAMDGMVAKFGERIAEMVSQRICLDHL